MSKNTNDTCKEQLEQLKKDFEEFAYIVSHDLKAPIRAVTNLSTWIEEDLGENLDPDVKHNMNLLRNRANRLEGMIEGMLEYSRVARTNLEVEHTDVPALLKEASIDLPAKVEMDIKEGISPIHTYKAKLKQVLSYVLQNAVTFSSKPIPSVRIIVQEQENELCFSIADDGEGIPEEALTKVFTLFYTVAPKDSVNTRGVGLAISKKIVQFAGGIIHAAKNDLGGATINFTWPKEVRATE